MIRVDSQVNLLEEQLQTKDTDLQLYMDRYREKNR